ncbi:SPOR domain-containing protein [Parerythrobacter jejuensis]|uniref:SPOR domain-containing protein n=1 Tax=Parerythrobacter jejuensis TaxID=795812 RepID=A0A845ARY7_9SPHN|nr:SPOR domain-containing protein [Parerythrobacter jejuensis]MXP31601.1 SPOR domain-containing protein [Parerythrobacter jejuensis]
MIAFGGDDEKPTSDEADWEETEDTEELELDDGDEPLPWLESSDYEEDEGVDTGRIIGFVVLALLALALLVGGFWWLTNRGADPELVADGSTIEAPDGEFKERPGDPGGKEFAGTGDVAPAVGEGQTREGRLAEGNRAAGSGSESGSSSASASGSAAGPSVNAPTSRNSGSAASGTASGTASATGGVGVQVGAYSTKATAQAGWSKLTRQTDALSGFKYRIVEGKADIGTVFRLQAVAGDAAAANRLCNALKAEGVACQVKR